MKKEKASKSRLTLRQIEKFKAILLAKRNEIISNVACMEGETLRKQSSDLSIMPIHMADMGTDNFETENTLGLMNSERKLLAEIDAALQRIENGTYGICEGSGKPIPMERLKAIPWARYCVEYASRVEKGLAPKEKSIGQTKYNYEITDEQDEGSEQAYRRAGKL